MPPLPNIAIKANVWCQPDLPNPDDIPYFLQPVIPGDLLVHFLGTREVRTVRQQLTPRQLWEYGQSRFFQNHGQEGLAFEEVPGQGDGL
jgi:hypothetical protein